jgi:ElaB/YqjD/DUF883 family membrane-anchored ribosome-binding protein
MTTTNKTASPSDGIGQRLQDAGDRFVEIKDDVANRLGKRVDSLGAIMKEHPLAAVGVGLGIGYLIARILHR